MIRGRLFREVRRSGLALITSVISIAVAAPRSSAQDVPVAACEQPILTLVEAGALLRVDAATLMGLAEQRQIPARRVGDEWRFSCRALLDWLASSETPGTKAEPIQLGQSGSPLSATDLSEVTGAGAQQLSQSLQEPASTDSGEAPAETIGEEPDEQTAEDIFLRSQRVLLAPAQVVIDFGGFFTEFNGAPLASIGDQTVLTTIEQETFLASLQARIGFRNETELFVGTTYFSEDNEAFLGNFKVANFSDAGFSGLNLGVRRTLMREGVGRPDIVGTLITRIPTDDGAYALGGSLAFVKSFDPVVLFSSIGYTHAFTDSGTDLVRIEPSDRVDVAFGYAFGLNDTLALSMSVAGAFTASERRENILLRQRDTYSLRFGLTSRLARGVYIEPSVSFSLGGPDDSFSFGLAVPYTLGR